MLNSDQEPIFTTDRFADRCVIRVRGEVDIFSAPRLRGLIFETPTDSAVVVDLTDCRYVDSSVLNLLVQTYRSRGGHLTVRIPPHGAVRRIFEVSGLAEHFERQTQFDGIASAKSKNRHACR